MLAAHEFFVGCLRDGEGLTLFCPRNRYEHTAVITDTGGSLVAIALEGTHTFVTFDCSTNEAWRGLLIPGISIEVDEQSVVDTDRVDPPLGSIARRGPQLCIAARASSGFRTACVVPLIAGLPAGRENAEIAFRKWQIVLGEGPAKRILKVIDLPAPAES